MNAGLGSDCRIGMDDGSIGLARGKDLGRVEERMRLGRHVK